MRLPADRENWTLQHLERAQALMWKRFAEYEDKYDADERERTDALYSSVLWAQETVIDIANAMNQCVATVDGPHHVCGRSARFCPFGGGPNAA